ncbi:monocarboxylate transporter 6-like isoform X3 [Pomacea canaliculata]|uniref:monocarboxylate transporter 6-like isoform X3 n=1 Tax=Pomacea canaliculata TaxID=400727 RepID=UPI000D728832|nr:monocarboxylate transporter 6-like isoform X3 [Pomacea canaliculata]
MFISSVKYRLLLCYRWSRGLMVTRLNCLSNKMAPGEDRSTCRPTGGQSLNVPDQKKHREGQRNLTRDVDCGWAWVVLASVFCLLALMLGFQRSRGLVFVEIEDKYKVSASFTSLIVIFVMTFVLEMMSVRQTVLIGVALLTSGVGVSFVVTSYPALIFTLGVMIGAGVSFASGPCFVLLGQYFDRRLTLATAVVNSGVSVGALVMPYLLRLLLDQYSLPGGLLVMSAVLANMFVCACLLRPFPASHRDSHSTCHLSGGKDDVASDPLPENTPEHRFHTERELSSTPGTQCLGELSPLIVSHESRAVDATGPIGSSRFPVFSNSVFSPSMPSTQHGEAKPISENISKQENLPDIHTSNFYKAETKSDSDQEHALPDQLTAAIIACDTLSPLKVSSDVKVHRGDNANAPRHDNESSLRFSDGNNRRTGVWLSAARRRLAQTFDISVFRSLAFWVLVLHQWFGVTAGLLQPVYLPPLAMEKGFSEGEATFMVMVTGGCDIFSRILPGVIANFKLLQPHEMVIASQVILGILLQFTFFFNTILSMMAFSAAMGALGGVIFSMTQIMIINFMGLHRFPVAYGYIQLFNATSSAANFPLAGYLRDTFGTSTTIFNYLGAAHIVSSTILLSFIVLSRCQQRCRNGTYGSL